MIQIPYRPIFSWSPLGRYPYNPFRSGLTQYPQRSRAILPKKGIQDVTLNGSPTLAANGYYVETSKYPTFPSADIISTTQGTIIIDLTPNWNTATLPQPGYFFDVRSAGGVGFIGYLVDTSGKIGFFWNGVAKAPSAGLTWTSGTKYRVGFTWSRNGDATYTVKTIRNGVERGSSADATTMGALNANLFIGRSSQAAAAGVNSWISLVQVFDKVLTAAQIGSPL